VIVVHVASTTFVAQMALCMVGGNGVLLSGNSLLNSALCQGQSNTGGVILMWMN
jgi:hypothetical protein